MDNVVSIPFAAGTVRTKNSTLISRLTSALSGLPDTEQERMVRLFELMALTVELELMEQSNGPKDRR